MKISEPTVMQSAGGWYIGRYYTDDYCGSMQFPYNRLSGYYKTREEAESNLKYYTVV